MSAWEDEWVAALEGSGPIPEQILDAMESAISDFDGCEEWPAKVGLAIIARLRRTGVDG